MGSDDMPAPLELRFPDSRGLVARHAWLSGGHLLVGFNTGKQRTSAAPHACTVSVLTVLQSRHGIASRKSVVLTLVMPAKFGSNACKRGASGIQQV